MVLQMMIFLLSIAYISPSFSYVVSIIFVVYSLLTFLFCVLNMSRNKCNISCVFFAYNSFMIFSSNDS